MNLTCDEISKKNAGVNGPVRGDCTACDAFSYLWDRVAVLEISVLRMGWDGR